MKKWMRFCVMMLCLCAAAFADNAREIKFIEAFSQDVLALLREHSDKPAGSAREPLQKVLDTYCNMDEIGKFALGRGWRQATADERQRFLNLFHQSLAADYAKQFQSYRNEKVEIVRATTTKDGAVLVTGTIERAGAAPVEITWLVRERDANLKVFDILVAGVSLSQTFRTEYATLLAQYNNKMESLLSNMAQKLEGTR